MTPLEMAVLGLAALPLAAGAAWLAAARRFGWLLPAAAGGGLIFSPWPSLALAAALGLVVGRLARPRPRPQRAAAPTEPGRPRLLEAVLGELDTLVGLGPVKATVKGIAARLRVDQARRARGLEGGEALSLNFLFSGRPGVAKTKVASMMAEILAALGALPSARLVHCGREDLVGNVIGETERRTAALIEAAEGGTLFVDEAHTLVRGGNDFGQIAIEMIARAMEDRRGRMAVIVAGYPEAMEALLASDPGLRQRFAFRIDFPDYGPDELAEIFSRMAAQSRFQLTAAAWLRLAAFCLELERYRGPTFGNGRLMRQLFQAARTAQALRLGAGSATASTEDLATLEAADLDAAMRQMRGTLPPPLR